MDVTRHPTRQKRALAVCLSHMPAVRDGSVSEAHGRARRTHHVLDGSDRDGEMVMRSLRRGAEASRGLT